MIRVRRGPTPASLDGPASAGGRERAEAEAHYAADPGRTDHFKDFDAYKGADVKAVLHEAFDGKCAYCESRYAATQPMDVEHFRPKGGYNDADGAFQKPGYYWLAAEWDNLLPSCTDCNRGRTQPVLDAETGELVRKVVGKKNQFPLTDEDDRARGPGEERDEDRLLLHPCRDFPERHLEFIEEGVVRPGLTASGAIRKKGRASIEAYALQRTGLVEARRDRLVLIESLMRRIAVLAGLLTRFEGDPDMTEAADAIGGVVEEDVADLRRFTDARQPFAAMARQRIEPFMAALIG